jgi:GDP-L-fucose synthase
MSDQKILLLGHTGFIGTAVASLLDSRGIDYVGVSRTSGFDLKDLSAFENLADSDDFSAIINCAAHVGGISYGLKFPRSILEDNTQMSLNIVKVAAKRKLKLVNPISNCAYPGHLSQYRASDFWRGQAHESVLAYALTRRFLVDTSILYSNLENFSVINIALPNTYGPGDHLDPERAHALGGMIYRALVSKKTDQENFTVWGSGKPIREWIYIDDVALALVNSLEVQSSHLLMNIGTGEGISIKDLASRILDAIDFKGKLVFDLEKPDGADKKVMVIENGPEILNWKPKTRLEEGLLKTISWYEQNI